MYSCTYMYYSTRIASTAVYTRTYPLNMPCNMPLNRVDLLEYAYSCSATGSLQLHSYRYLVYYMAVCVRPYNTKQ